MTTSQGQQIAESWLDPAFAMRWNDHDQQNAMLEFPRRLAAALVAVSLPTEPVSTVLDIASGPGAFLATFLDTFPAAAGICTDASPAMLDLGRGGLERFGDRVRYELVDMTALSAAASLPAEVDVILTSRATHHLDVAGLDRFYRAAAELIQPGGWLFNLDHTYLYEPWAQWVRAARREIIGTGSDQSQHVHLAPLPSLDAHLAALRAVGLSAQPVWQAFHTVLIAATRTAT